MSTVKEPQDGGDEGMRGAVEFDVEFFSMEPPLAVVAEAPAEAIPPHQGCLPFMRAWLVDGTFPEPEPVRPPPPPSDLVQISPTPIKAKVNRLWVRGDWVTAVTRRWKDGEAAICRRCPLGTCCVDEDNECIYLWDGPIPKEDAWDHSPASFPGFVWDGALWSGDRGVLGSGAPGTAGPR
jgi:hypothetical protein